MKFMIIVIMALIIANPEPPYTPTSGYRTIQIEGFEVLVNKELEVKEPELARDAIKELSSQLYLINRRVPERALLHLKGTKIWLELDNSKGACHHPNKQWLINNNYNPEKVGCVEIGNARNFVSWTKDQPYMVLHEMAHHYHYKVLGYGHQPLKEQYKKAKAGGSYDKVLHIKGKYKLAYAMNNVKEYFAESTEAFFGTNDFYPFVRSELKEHDPEMYLLLDKLWTNPPANFLGEKQNFPVDVK